jgi:hypothetical protein
LPIMCDSGYRESDEFYDAEGQGSEMAMEVDYR